MEKREIRMGIDVGGTFTKAVAIDNATHKVIGKSSVKTTHSDPMGVAAGVIRSFQNCLEENNIASEDVIFVAHSTTQATNALLEGDVANVGIFGSSGGGLEGFLAKRQCRLPDIDLKTGKSISITNIYVKEKDLSDENISKAIDDLKSQGAQVIVASIAFGVDGMKGEKRIKAIAEEKGFLSPVASEITKLYGLTRRTRTAAINASILPKMLETATSTEASVRSANVQVPLMIMRGDGGVMDIAEMKKRPVLTMLSGPAASVMGSLMYLRASNGVYFEVGGTSTNIGVIKNGRPAIDYTVLGGHRTYINSLDVRVLGVAGGSLCRASKTGVVDVGPRSAHIAGLEYSVYTDLELIEEPTLELFTPKTGDPSDYCRIRLKNGQCIAITNSCAANVLGLVQPHHFSYGKVESARKAMQPLADYMNTTVEEVAKQILQKTYDKINPVIDEFAAKYKLEKDQMSLVGVGGGAATLIINYAEKKGLNYSIPEQAEVISSIGVALAMVRDVVERIIPNPSQDDIRRIRKEAKAKAIESGAVPDSIDVHIEIDPTTQKVTAIALGSTEVRTSDLLKECSDEEALAIAADDMRIDKEQVELLCKNGHFYVFTVKEAKKGKKPIRILDKRGFIKAQRGDGTAIVTKVKDYKKITEKLWVDYAIFRGDIIQRPDFYLCAGARIMDFTSSEHVDQLFMLMEVEFADYDPDDEIIITAVKFTS